MKNLILYALSIFVLVSCSKKIKLPEGFVRISGKVDNFKKGDSLTLTNFYPQDTLKSFTVDSDGRFTDTVYVKNKTSNLFKFIVKNSLAEDDVKLHLNLYSGDDLEVVFDIDSIETIQFEGKGKGVLENRYNFVERPKLIKSLFGTLANSLLISDSISETELKEKLDTYKEKNTLLLEKLEDSVLLKKYLNGQSNFMPNIAFNYINGKTFKNFYLGDDTISKSDLDEKIEVFKKEAIPFVEKYYPLSNVKQREIYEGHIETTVSSINSQYESIRYKKSLNGQPCPKFLDYENYSGGVSSLDDFKGQYVYIDLWATWCGPCKAEIPFLQKIEKQYHDKNIAFVSISLDRESDYKKWRKMVKDKSLSGVQLFAKNQDFARAVKATGIPRFLFVDPKGNFISADAPRPSNPDLIKLFDNYNF